MARKQQGTWLLPSFFLFNLYCVAGNTNWLTRIYPMQYLKTLSSSRIRRCTNHSLKWKGSWIGLWRGRKLKYKTPFQERPLYVSALYYVFVYSPIRFMFRQRAHCGYSLVIRLLDRHGKWVQINRRRILKREKESPHGRSRWKAGYSRCVNTNCFS